MNNSKEIGELLIAKGVDINAIDIIYLKIEFFFLMIMVEKKKWIFNNQNYTPLHFAAQNNSIEIGKLLISKGADINERDIIYLNKIINSI